MNRAPLPSPKLSKAAQRANVTASSPTSTRPPLQRLPASQASHQPTASKGAPTTLPVSAEEDEDTDTSDNASGGESKGRDQGAAGAIGTRSDASLGKSSPDELEVERLRNLQLRAIQIQQRSRMKSGAVNLPNVEALGRRPSPIKEETALSPTLEEAFISPLATGHTESTASTESAKTIRGSVPPTPAARAALRTPSYPFPTVPNTPTVWATSFHQPFTSLSPTVSAMYTRDYGAPREHIASESSTPAASGTPFAPGARMPHSPVLEDPRFPSPNMYDLVLLLNSEPGLAAWWTCVTNIMHDWYGVERATLAVPADSSDIENVPWGQKTTYHATSPEDSPRGPTFHDARMFSSSEAVDRPRSPERATPVDLPAMPLASDRRPKFPTRHSFAGHERQSAPESPVPNSALRPRGPLRTASHAPQSGTRPSHPLRQVSPMSFDGTSHFQSTPTPSKEPAFSDPEFSSIGEGAPPNAVFPVLRALDHEPDALIDNAGISRVLERGRLVTLTRDYSTSLSQSRRGSLEPDHEKLPKVSQKHPSAPALDRNVRGNVSLSTKGTSMERRDPSLQPRYEEYEQFPSSPWAQSPAPSPAIQNDPSENPFFSTGNVDEDSFNPTASSQDYSQYGQVEAIGVDKASTVSHVPLIHPLLSQTMQPPEPETPSCRPSRSHEPSDQSSDVTSPFREDAPRKAPIAILSILSPIVPYPRNLTISLKHLGPHLATSFSNAWQFTNAQTQAAGVRQRRQMTGQQTTFLSSDKDSLDDLLHLDLEDISHSTGGSVTSPSDYSGKSRYSPGGSITGTPGWDAASLGFSSRQSVGSTPGQLTGSEAVESYFDTRKKTITRASGHSASASQEQTRKPEKRTTKRASFSKGTKGEEPSSSHDDKLLTDETSRTLRQRTKQPQGHSLLHSYGADFSSSFQSLPTATTPALRATAVSPSPSKIVSMAESSDIPMPPPSENLLRTIIDSLPVQIFTALPASGALTWANSKFLIFRGQEEHQVLQGPWDAIHPEDRDDYLEQWNKSLRTGQQLQKKVRLRRFDDCYRWFYVRVAPLKNKRQQIVHWIGTNMDFHDQHLAELNSARQQETAASEAKYRALANSSPQIVFVVSDRRGLTFCNSQWETFSGQTEVQAHGNGFLEHVHPEDVIKCKLPEMNEDGTAVTNVPTSMPPEHTRQNSSSSEDSSETEKTVTSPGPSAERIDLPQAKLSKLASTGILRISKDADGRASYSTEVRLRNKDGEYRWHLVRILLEKSLAEETGEETWYGTATDINDHKLLEQTLKETMDAKSRFLSNMSHEIRTPLNGISGMVNFLLDSTLNGEQLEHVNIIKASTDSLLNLINDILDLSKVEAGMIKLTKEWMHIPSLLEEVNDLNMGLAIQKGLELNYLVDEGVPLMVKGDKFRIRQVLLNVVGNAIKFTQRGEIFVRCRPQPADRADALKDNEAMIQFEIVDTGRGFNDQEAKYLFKRFSQIDASSTRQHGGTGLGLAISMQFVELHGGKMDARSIPGKGSTFFFSIRFGLPTDEDFPKPQVATPGTPAADPVTLPPLPVQPSPLHKPAFPQIAAHARQGRLSSTSSEKSDSIKSPVPSLTTSDRSRESPSLSSGSSDHSLTSSALTGKSSVRSERSSASSYLHEVTLAQDSDIKLALPIKRIGSDRDARSDESTESLRSEDTVRPVSLSPLTSALQPPMYSILVVCPLVHSREATIRHIKNTLPAGIPHQVTGQSSLLDAQRMLGGDDPVLFTHVVLVLHDTAQVVAIMDQILNSMVHGNASIVVVSDPAQKRELVKVAPAYDYDQLVTDRRLEFIYRPLKPSKFAVIFDPQKQRESSTDRNQDTAQQVVFNQKLVFEELKRRLGDKGHKVLLVEDNHINQTASLLSEAPLIAILTVLQVILKFLAKINIETETVLDGVQCTDIVFSKPPGYYSIILVSPERASRTCTC
jgi:signal transduction histidine kinase